MVRYLDSHLSSWARQARSGSTGEWYMVISYLKQQPIGSDSTFFYLVEFATNMHRFLIFLKVTN